MGRSDSSKGQNGAMRGQIIVAATKLFAARGYDATSLQAIADMVGIRKTSLLYYFPSKDALYRSVLNELLGRWNEDLPRLLKAATTGEHRYDAVMRELLAFFVDDANRARLLVRGVLDHPEEMRTILQAYFAPWIQLVSEYIRKGQKEGSVYADLDPEAYVVLVLHLILGAVSMAEVAFALHTSEPSPQHVHSRQLDEIMRLARSALFQGEAAKVPNTLSENRESRQGGWRPESDRASKQSLHAASPQRNAKDSLAPSKTSE